jgi:hypothetical protein
MDDLTALHTSPDGYWDVQCVASDVPGVLAHVLEALERAGLPLTGFNAFTGAGTAIIHLCTPAPEATKRALRDSPVTIGRARRARLVNLPHREGALGDLAATLAGSGVNIEVCYLTHDPLAGTRLVVCLAD